MDNELSKEEAERRAREVARRMLTTPKPKKAEASQKKETESSQKRALKHGGKG